MPASAHAAPAKALGWVKVKSYIPANAANLARCKKDGQYYADGSTGYQCKYFPNTYAPHQGKSHYELWVGP
ncbi:hypothetical protein HS041_30395 [Planomonospora sp. ID67723]|uniref:hypothetical protein n=1 Tax=Planomonospora sp. ID67723 TaxID=2738134 RepID=UPI0018C3D63E|nr:hypothetical protein [Planomonospora sp. ID67723]MBG0832018.1 hypothetical protein [Planomonospora sp. ID67723]